MFLSLPLGTPLYRVTGLNQTSLSYVLSGHGSYFTSGGRYNAPHQRTVYASDDALVAITEAAFHQARDWQQRLEKPTLPPPTYPLVSQHRLWYFTIDPTPTVVDLTDPAAPTVFQYPPHLLVNPGTEYINTQLLANKIRAYRTPGQPQPEGLRAPSVRTPPPPNYVPCQYAFFVMPTPYTGTTIERWQLTLEFLDTTQQSVSFNTYVVDWSEPRFQLTGSRALIPVFAPRPAAIHYDPRRWYQIEIKYS